MPPRTATTHCNGTSLFCGMGHFYFALTRPRFDNISYVNSDTTTVHVHCVQCGGERLAVTGFFQQYQRPCPLRSPRRPGRLRASKCPAVAGHGRYWMITATSSSAFVTGSSISSRPMRHQTRSGLMFATLSTSRTSSPPTAPASTKPQLRCMTASLHGASHAARMRCQVLG